MSLFILDQNQRWLSDTECALSILNLISCDFFNPVFSASDTRRNWTEVQIIFEKLVRMRTFFATFASKICVFNV